MDQTTYDNEHCETCGLRILSLDARIMHTHDGGQGCIKALQDALHTEHALRHIAERNLRAVTEKTAGR